jgi:hypothetical protein
MITRLAGPRPRHWLDGGQTMRDEAVWPGEPPSPGNSKRDFIK